MFRMALQFAPMIAPTAPSPHISSIQINPASLARFPICLNLPPGQNQFFNDAAEAVRREYRSSIRAKRLRCRKVSALSERPGETIFVLEIGHSIELIGPGREQPPSGRMSRIHSLAMSMPPTTS